MATAVPNSTSPTLHPIFLKQPSLEINHERYVYIWKMTKVIGRIGIVGLGCGIPYAVFRAVSWKLPKFRPIQIFSAFILPNLFWGVMMFVWIDILFSEYVNKKITHHQKKGELQLEFNRIKRLNDDKFRGLLKNLKIFSDEEIDQLLIIKRERLILPIVKYIQAIESFKQTNREFQSLQKQLDEYISHWDEDGKIKEGQVKGEAIGASYRVFSQEVKDLNFKVLELRIEKIRTCIWKAYYQKLLKNPQFAGNLKTDLLFLGYVPFGKISKDHISLLSNAFLEGQIAKIASASNWIVDFEPLMFTHTKSRQTVTLKFMDRLINDDVAMNNDDAERRLRDFLFNQPNQLATSYLFKSKHITYYAWSEVFEEV